MKTVLTILAFCLSFAAIAQTPATSPFDSKEFPIDQGTLKILYTSVVEVPKATQATLDKNTTEWFLKNAKDYKYRPLVKEPGIQAYTGVFDLAYKNLAGQIKIFPVSHKVTVSQKEGKYKYEFTDFNIYFGRTPLEAEMILLMPYKKNVIYSEEDLAMFKTDLPKYTNALIKDLEVAMKKADW